MRLTREDADDTKPLGPVITLDAHDLERRENGEVVPMDSGHRSTLHSSREDSVDYGCYLANIKLLGVVRAHSLWITFRGEN